MNICIASKQTGSRLFFNLTNHSIHYLNENVENKVMASVYRQEFPVCFLLNILLQLFPKIMRILVILEYELISFSLLKWIFKYEIEKLEQFD